VAGAGLSGDHQSSLQGAQGGALGRESERGGTFAAGASVLGRVSSGRASAQACFRNSSISAVSGGESVETGSPGLSPCVYLLTRDKCHLSRGKMVCWSSADDTMQASFC
jgi:hypothetical protein